jgi:hypothetical protein
MEGRPNDYETWSEKHVLRELRRRIAAGKQLSAAFIKVCTRYFGTTEAARTAAGIPMTKARRRSPDQLLRALRTRARTRAPLEPALRRALASWLELGWAETGCAAEKMMRTFRGWTVERVLDALRDALGKGEVGHLDPKLARAAAWYFGDVANARRVAGVPEVRRKWTREAILQALREHHHRRRRGAPLALVIACRRYFGSIELARRAAGLPVLRRRWTKQAIVAELRQKWRDRPLKDGALAHACVREFGGVPAARRAAGLPYL